MPRGLNDVCAAFNRHQVEYMVAGAQAGALHGHIRATEDIDLLIRNTPENVDRAVAALTVLFPDLPEAVAPADITDNIVLKVADDIEVDVSISAWSVAYDEAERDREERIVDGTQVPYMGLRSLIKSKMTSREVDQWDVRVLSEILRRQEGSGG